MKKVIEKKLNYYKGIEGKMVAEFLKTNRRESRDGLIRTRERIITYQDLLENLKEA